MGRGMRGWVVWVLSAAALAACAPAVSPTPPPEPVPVAKAPAPAPEPAPAPPALDPRTERRLVKDLHRDVEEYYRLLQEKDVDRAAAYVQADRREGFKDVLWQFVATYHLQSADLVSYQLTAAPQGGAVAKVKVLRTLFEKYSVVPQKSEEWTTWEYHDGRWALRP
ncbi:MAG: hypothetical protein Kow0092_01630 [Deferrisomatales bacterium]